MKKRLMIVGAHPDDAEFNAGGLMLRYAEQGCAIAITCLTDGSAGHQTQPRKDLAKRRAQEAANAARQLGAELTIWPDADGALQPTLARRERLIHEIRVFAPDLLITHRPYDYHPDHRAAAQLVQDACYMVRVPNVVPEIPALREDVVVAYMCDFFSLPQPFTPDVVVPLDDRFAAACDLLSHHKSQVEEWLPYTLNEPGGPDWLEPAYRARASSIARRFAGGHCELAEAFQLGEYGRQVGNQALRELCLLDPITI